MFKCWWNTLLQEGTPSLCLHLWGHSCTGSQEPHRSQSSLGIPLVLDHAVLTSDPVGEKTRRWKWRPMQQPQRRRRRRGSTGPSCQPELLQQNKTIISITFSLLYVIFHTWWDRTGPEPAKSDAENESMSRQCFKRVQRTLNQIWTWGVLGWYFKHSSAGILSSFNNLAVNWHCLFQSNLNKSGWKLAKSKIRQRGNYRKAEILEWITAPPADNCWNINVYLHFKLHLLHALKKRKALFYSILSPAWTSVRQTWWETSSFN